MTEQQLTPTSSSEHMITATGLCKTYRVFHGQDRGWVKSMLMPWWKRRFYDEYHALVDVDLQIGRGEIVGVLGRNGAGKSTLLRVLAGITLPTSGTVHVRGVARSLLATGIAFDPRFTGRQNILFGSVAMGIPERVVRERMDEIIEFSELGDNIDKPTMIYSDGMRTKLAFSVAFQETPEILLLDEALAAGDVFFRSKCDQRISEIVSSGSTVVMATHSLSAIDHLCTHGILLEHGRVVADGAPRTVLDRYRDMLAESEADRPKQLVGRGAAPVRSAQTVTAMVDSEGVTAQSLEFIDARMIGPDGVVGDTFNNGDPVELRIRLRGIGELPTLRFTLDLFSEDFGLRVASMGTEHLSADTGDLGIFPLFELRGEQELTIRLPRNPLGSGLYSWTLSVRPFDSESLTPGGPGAEYLRRSRITPFRSVSFPGHSIGRLRRMVLEPEVEMSLQPATEQALWSVGEQANS